MKIKKGYFSNEIEFTKEELADEELMNMVEEKFFAKRTDLVEALRQYFGLRRPSPLRRRSMEKKVEKIMSEIEERAERHAEQGIRIFKMRQELKKDEPRTDLQRLPD